MFQRKEKTIQENLMFILVISECITTPPKFDPVSHWVFLIFTFNSRIVQSGGAIEYTDFTSAEG